MNTKAALNKLVSILTKQNIVLKKLAQQADQQVKQYLESAVGTAAANTGVTSQYSVNVQATPASTPEPGVTSEESYMVRVTFTPPLTDEAKKQKLMNNFYTFIKVNRPELKLEGRVSFIFA